jgi:hypothetical protein
MADLERYPDGDVEENGLLAYRLFRPVLPHVLVEELEAEAGTEALHLTFEGDISAASEEDPVIIYVPETVNTKHITRVLASHDHRAAPHAMDAIRMKLDHDEQLTMEEVSQALKFLLGA